MGDRGEGGGINEERDGEEDQNCAQQVRVDVDCRSTAGPWLASKETTEGERSTHQSRCASGRASSGDLASPVSG